MVVSRVPSTPLRSARYQLLEPRALDVLRKAVERLESGFNELPGLSLDPAGKEIEKLLIETADRLKDNYPYFHPLYIGQMLKPPHIIARLAYALALWINPNNHALDGGRASSQMEKEAVAHVAKMFGWKEHLGHLCSGGTMANLEALWVAGQLAPGKKILASSQAHYTHRRLSKVLKLDFEEVPCDRFGRLDVTKLAKRVKKGDVGTVIATIGTTATGSVDPLPQIIELRQLYKFRLHADAAYGGYFVLAENLPEGTLRSFERLGEVDSIVIDPHKHGLQPYGCGCVLFRDPEVGRLYKHDSPYTYFTSDELHLGEISLECSRPGAAAVALWATQKLLPLVKRGEFAGMLEQSRAAAMTFFDRLERDARFATAFAPELDIVFWSVRSRSVRKSSSLARQLFTEAGSRHLHLALATLPADFFEPYMPRMKRDADQIVCVRSAVMKPLHGEWLERIWQILDTSVGRVLKN